MRGPADGAPGTLGHEPVGRVVEVGGGVDTIATSSGRLTESFAETGSSQSIVGLPGLVNDADAVVAALAGPDLPERAAQALALLACSPARMSNPDGEPPRRRGAGHPSFGPSGVYRTADGELAIGVGADSVFARLAGAVGAPHQVADERFATNAARMQHGEELSRELEARLAGRSCAEWVALLTAANVPAELVADAAAVLADPRLAAVDAWPR